MTVKEELALINTFSRRELGENDVYVFTLTLCDNEVDRDFERFSENSLIKLCELFKGKTGITDHSMRSKDQAARIFHTFISKDEAQKNSLGEPYIALKAKAYMVKTESNADLIAEIDGGIKKEVSVSCSTEKCICSICGKDMRRHECRHIKGKTYTSKLCYGILENPTDAYEWSFVAVPAQRLAGVTKAFKKEALPLEKGIDIIKSITENTVISQKQAKEITDYVCELEELASEVLSYKKHLTEDIERYALLVMPKVNTKHFISGCGNMSLDELRSLKKGLEKQASDILPPFIQLRNPSNQNTKDNTAFKI